MGLHGKCVMSAAFQMGFFSLSLEMRTLSFLLEMRTRKKKTHKEKENMQNDSELMPSNALYIHICLCHKALGSIKQGMEGGAVKDPRLESEGLGSRPGSAPNNLGDLGQTTLSV